jgi:anti-sigma factor RsiW
MSGACDAFRKARLDGGAAADAAAHRAHATTCPACHGFAAALASTDAGLAADAAAAGRGPLPADLRARILAAASASPSPRGKLLDFALRAAAVAAVLLVAAAAAPVSLAAAPFPDEPAEMLFGVDLLPSSGLAAYSPRVPRLDDLVAAADAADDLPTIPVAATAAALLAAGLLLLRRRVRG